MVGTSPLLLSPTGLIDIVPLLIGYFHHFSSCITNIPSLSLNSMEILCMCAFYAFLIANKHIKEKKILLMITFIKFVAAIPFHHVIE